MFRIKFIGQDNSIEESESYTAGEESSIKKTTKLHESG